MDNPVKLPNGEYYVDMLTIEKHLKNDKKHPFTNIPLDIKDVLPLPELKKKID